MNRREIRHLRPGDPIAYRLDLAVEDAWGCRTGRFDAVQLPARVTEIGVENGEPWAAFEGTTQIARGFLLNFSSGVVDRYSFRFVTRLPGR